MHVAVVTLKCVAMLEDSDKAGPYACGFQNRPSDQTSDA